MVSNGLRKRPVGKLLLLKTIIKKDELFRIASTQSLYDLYGPMTSVVLGKARKRLKIPEKQVFSRISSWETIVDFISIRDRPAKPSSIALAASATNDTPISALRGPPFTSAVKLV